MPLIHYCTIALDHLFCNHFSKKSVEKWFFKLGFFFFFWSTTFLQPEKMWIYSIKPHLFWSTTFLKPLFYNFLEKWLQNKPQIPCMRIVITVH